MNGEQRNGVLRHCAGGQPVVLLQLTLSECCGKVGERPVELVRRIGERRDSSKLLDVLLARVIPACLLQLAEVVEALPQRIDGGARVLLALDDAERLEEGLESSGVPERPVERPLLPQMGAELQGVRAEERRREGAKRGLLVVGLPAIGKRQFDEVDECVHGRVQRGGEWRVEGNPVAAKRVGEARPDLPDRPREDRDLSQRDTVEAQRRDLAGDPVRLLRSMTECAPDDPCGTSLRSRQRLAAVAVHIAADDARRKVDDGRCGPVVGRQVVANCAGPRLLEAERVLQLGSAKAVDRLILVRDDEHVAVLPRDQVEEAILGDVGVLVLVDEHVPEGVRVARAELVVSAQHALRLPLEAAVVERAERIEISAIAVAHRGQRMVGRFEVVVGERAEGERLRDECVRTGQVEPVRGLQCLLDQPALLCREHEPRCRVHVPLQEREAEAVEGRHGEARVAPAEPVGESLAKVARRLAREGEDEQLLGPHVAVVDQPRRATDDYSRLAGTRAGEDNRRPFAVTDSSQLVRV